MEPVLWSVKYRPKKWDDFVGQDSAIEKLKKLAEKKTCPNMIFFGPSGTGKTSAVFTFTESLLEETFSSNFKFLNIRDLITYPITKAKRSLKQLAKLDRSERTEFDEYMSFVFNEAKARRRLQGRYGNPNRSQMLHTAIDLFASTISVADELVKVLVLDEADALSNSMQQSLRRTMEIYNEACRFILVTPALAGWSPAIISRCLLLRFPYPQLDVVTEYVQQIADKENVDIDPLAVGAIARESKGDLRRAISLLQVSAAGSTKVTEDDVFECSQTPLESGTRKIVTHALAGSFLKARKELRRLLTYEGYEPVEVMNALNRELRTRPFTPETRSSIMERVAQIDHRITEAKNPFIQLTALIASLKHLAKE